MEVVNADGNAAQQVDLSVHRAENGGCLFAIGGAVVAQLEEYDVFDHIGRLLFIQNDTVIIQRMYQNVNFF